MAENTPEKADDLKAKRERSTAYPFIALEQALEYSAKLVEAYRKSPFSRLNAVEGIGYTKITGDTAQKIAALVHYGLLERSGNSAYRNTLLAQNICYFTSEEKKALDIITAAQKPKLFRTLLAEFEGQSLPARLKNILIQPHGITPAVADKVAENFKKTLEYSGLLVNGVVAAVPAELATRDETDKPGDSGAPAPAPAAFSNRAPALAGGAFQRVTPTPAGMQSLPLPCGVVISYPAELAYQFAIGKFGTQITALDEAITAAKTKSDDELGNDTSSTRE